MPSVKRFPMPLAKYRAVPGLSWSLDNLYLLWKRTSMDSPIRFETDFQAGQKSIFQQRWLARRLTKGYHAEQIAATKFERWYLPDALPLIKSGDETAASTSEISKWVEGRQRAGGRTQKDKRVAQMEKDGTSPVGTLMFNQTERCLDVVIFRSCFAPSVWAARQYINGGFVKLNGKVVRNAQTLLNPGDLFTINPKAIQMIQRQHNRASIAEELEAAKAKAGATAAADAAVDAEESAESGEDGVVEVVAAEEAEPTEAELMEKRAAEAEAAVDAAVATHLDAPPVETNDPSDNSYFRLPFYASPWIFVPAYIMPSYLTCSGVYVRHPTARPGYSEVPSPYDADGDLMSLSWEWYQRVAPRMRDRRRARLMDPQRSQDRK